MYFLILFVSVEAFVQPPSLSNSIVPTPRNMGESKELKGKDIIGFVGTSGRSTGPHLHYEIIVNNKQVNPYKLKLPDGKKLAQEDFKDFEKEINKILSKIKKINDE